MSELRLKVLTWNCNLNFTQKYDALKDDDADIMVIQECEQEFTIHGGSKKFKLLKQNCINYEKEQNTKK